MKEHKTGLCPAFLGVYCYMDMRTDRIGFGGRDCERHKTV